MITLYTLTDPETNAPRYIGKTRQKLYNRLATHVHKAKRGHDTSPKGDWIRALLAQGLRPGIESLIELPDGSDWKRAEREQIATLKAKGADLLNVMRGGNGSHRIEGRIEITPEIEARLGQESDAAIAEDLGVTRKAITYHREVRGIPASNDRSRVPPPPPMGGHNRIELPDEILSLLGAMPDEALAERAGVSKRRIFDARHARGIPSQAEQTGNDGRFDGSGAHPRWSREDPAYLTLPDSIVSQLGTRSDSDLAAAAGVHPRTIARAREHHNIGPYQWWKHRSPD